eukprot:3147493-Rhodomonas_salina.2
MLTCRDGAVAGYPSERHAGGCVRHCQQGHSPDPATTSALRAPRAAYTLLPHLQYRTYRPAYAPLGHVRYGPSVWRHRASIHRCRRRV